MWTGLSALIACLTWLFPVSVRAAGACEIELFGKIYEVHYISPAGGVFPRINAISEAVEYDEGAFGKEIASTVVGVRGGSSAMTFSPFLGQSVLDPNAQAGLVRSEAEDISGDARYVIGWREERPDFGNPPKAFIFSNEDGFQFLEDLYPSLREMATRLYPPGPNGRAYGTKGLAINSAGQMIIQSVPAEGFPQGYYLVQPGGSAEPVQVNSLRFDLNEQGQLPGAGMNAINDLGVSVGGNDSDINNRGYVGEAPGFVRSRYGRVDLRSVIRSQCDDPTILGQVTENWAHFVYINDANHISYGHLMLTPACPDVEIRTMALSGLEFINGRPSIRVGTRFSVRTTVYNFDRGSVGNISLTPVGTSPYYRLISPLWPPVPDRLGPMRLTKVFRSGKLLLRVTTKATPN